MKLNIMRKVIPNYYRVLEKIPEEFRNSGDAFFEDGSSITVEWSERKSMSVELTINATGQCEWWVPGGESFGEFAVSDEQVHSELIDQIKRVMGFKE